MKNNFIIPQSPVFTILLCCVIQFGLSQVNLYNWQIEYLPVPAEWGASFASLALDSVNNPYIVTEYWTGSPWICSHFVLAKKLDSTWSIETIEQSWFHDYLYPSIALDKFGRVYISFVYYGFLKYAQWNGANWDIEVVDSMVNGPCHIAVDSRCRPHISYHATPGLKYAVKTRDQWDITTLASGNYAGFYNSICLDDFDGSHIAYTAGWSPENLWYCFLDGDVWNYEEIASWPPYRPIYISICVDSLDCKHISFIDEDNMNRGPLMYAFRAQESKDWRITTAVSTYCGGGTSIALDTMGYPHIASYRYVDLMGWYYLMLASKPTTDWQYELVDAYSYYDDFYRDNVVNLTFDSNNNPHIAYEVEWWVKYALGTEVGIEEKHEEFAAYNIFLRNYPNPFRIITNIEYELPHATQVTLAIYNSAGRHVRTLIDRKIQMGKCRVYWNRKDKNGIIVPDGVYFCKFTAGSVGGTDNHTITKKLLVIH